MKPYFERAGISLYHGDALEVLPQLTETADLLLTDPPYGVNYKSRKFGRIANDKPSDRPLVLRILQCAIDRLRASRHAYVFGGLTNREAEELRLSSGAELIWDKEVLGQGNLSLPWGAAHEKITFAVHHSSRKARAEGRGRLSARLRNGSVLREKRRIGVQANLHPTEKPIRILRQMIESSSCLGELVLDPFAGSGSTLIAAVVEGRRAIGIELEERYCETAAKRLTEVTAHFDLFTAAAEGRPR